MREDMTMLVLCFGERLVNASLIRAKRAGPL